MAKDFSKIRFECLKLMLRPVVGFCLRNSATVQEFLEAGKHVFIELAAEEMEKNDSKVNVSRLSVMTGMHRRDVMRIHREGESREQPEGIAIRVIGQWTQDKRFLTAAKKPRILSVDGEDSEFKELVKLVSSDVNPGTVLFELERIAAVERVARGLKLKLGSYQASKGDLEGYKILARDTGDLMGAVEENIVSDQETPNLHARTEYDNVAASALPEIRNWVLIEGSRFHRKAREFIAQYDRDINPELKDKSGVKVVVGSFSLTEGKEA